MAVDEEAIVDPRRLSRMLLQDDVEQFYYEKQRSSTSIATPTGSSCSPTTRTTACRSAARGTRRELDKEFTKPGEMAYFDDDKMLLNGAR